MYCNIWKAYKCIVVFYKYQNVNLSSRKLQLCKTSLRFEFELILIESEFSLFQKPPFVSCFWISMWENFKPMIQIFYNAKR